MGEQTAQTGLSNPVAVTAGDFALAVHEGLLRPGDCVSVAPASPTWVQRLIARIQRRLIVDLLAGTDEPEAVEQMAAAYAPYSHSMMILSAKYAGEMTRPAARALRWAAVLAPGDRLLVTRPRGASRGEGDLAAAYVAAVCSEAVRYPTRELLHYYVWSWGVRKLAMGERFRSVFANRADDVCSGTVWRAWRASGTAAAAGATGGDVFPEAWYPARLAMPGEIVEHVAACVVRAGTGAVDDAVFAARPRAAACGKCQRHGQNGQNGRNGRNGQESGAMNARVQRAMVTVLVLMGLLGIVALCGGCGIGLRAPGIVVQRGPETNYNQERSGVTSRSTAAQQQVAETTAEQQQQENATTADMPTQAESTRQVGLRQGLEGTTAKTVGDTSPGAATREGGGATGQEGGSATSLGQTADAQTNNAAPDNASTGSAGGTQTP